LNTLASVAPGWLRPRIESEWLARYGPCVTDLRHARYIGLAKTRLRHVITSATPGTRLRVICRLSDWFAERPRASVRITPFVELATASPQFVPTREDRQQ